MYKWVGTDIENEGKREGGGGEEGRKKVYIYTHTHTRAQIQIQFFTKIHVRYIEPDERIQVTHPYPYSRTLPTVYTTHAYLSIRKDRSCRKF